MEQMRLVDKTGRKFAYLRAAKTEPLLDDQQVIALMDTYSNGVWKYVETDGFLFEDHAAGDSMDRPGWRVLNSQMQAGDELTVFSLDRISTNYENLAEVLKDLADRQIKLRVLDAPALSTADMADEKEAERISETAAEIMQAVAMMDREKRKKRHKEGLDRAKAENRVGRPRATTKEKLDGAYERYKSGELTSAEAAAEAGVSRATFFRLIKPLADAEKPGGPNEEKGS